MRIVVDTNILVAAAYNARSSSRRIVEAAQDGTVKLILSPNIVAEYQFIVPRAVRSPQQRSLIAEWVRGAELVHPATTARIVPDDPDDDKFIAAAVEGFAEVLVTNDHHVLVLDPYEGVRVLRPGEFVRQYLQEEHRPPPSE